MIKDTKQLGVVIHKLVQTFMNQMKIERYMEIYKWVVALMTITRDIFNEFWTEKGQYLRIKNADRFRENLMDKIGECLSVEDLDQYVCTLRTGKESTRGIIVEFYNYLNRTGEEIDSVLFEKHFYDYPFERQLEIAKYLHNPHTPKEIQEKFDIDERTVRNDLQELEDGITVLGSTIKIEKEKKGRSYFYKTTLHPIFLPLNLTEIYALTVYLERSINCMDPNAQIIRDISERIKLQLSDYAYGKLFPDDERVAIENQYLNDEQLARQREGIIMYLMKSGQKCKFIWNEKEYMGRIVWQDNQYKICDDNDEVIDAKLSEVDFVVEELEYQ